MSRLSYADFVHNNLLLRLGMRDSGYDSHRQILFNRASGYAARTNIDWEAPSHAPEVLFNAEYVNIDWAFAAGGLYSTVEDLLRWEKGLFSGNVLSPASLARMITPFLGGYACGLHVMKINGHRVINHNGGIDGFSSHLAYYPDDRVTVTVLSNVRARSVAPVAAELAVLAIGK
jgi:CubicO group peptidase (beta-lactamase class C family)